MSTLIHAARPWWLGLCILLGLSALGFLLGRAAIEVREYERAVTVKGLSEREYPADRVIWPVTFSAASNELPALYADLEGQSRKVVSFLLKAGIATEDISVSAPQVTDKSAQAWGDAAGAPYRYVGSQSVTVYSHDVNRVRGLMDRLLDLGKQGVTLAGEPHRNRAQFLFTRLNEVKPPMVEEATGKAREVALKFAQDSDSRLGKIRRASQGQFSIDDRDSNTPHIKKVRVVSTVEYYLSD